MAWIVERRRHLVVEVERAPTRGRHRVDGPGPGVGVGERRAKRRLPLRDQKLLLAPIDRPRFGPVVDRHQARVQELRAAPVVDLHVRVPERSHVDLPAGRFGRNRVTRRRTVAAAPAGQYVYWWAQPPAASNTTVTRTMRDMRLKARPRIANCQRLGSRACGRSQLEKARRARYSSSDSAASSSHSSIAFCRRSSSARKACNGARSPSMNLMRAAGYASARAFNIAS